MSAPELFSWLSSEARYLPGARHAENTHDAAGGIALILGMVEASDLAAETEGKANLTANDRAILIRLAMASARMLRDEARQHIDWLNTHGIARAASQKSPPVPTHDKKEEEAKVEAKREARPEMLQKLDTLIGLQSRPTVPLKDELWDKDQAGAYLGVSGRQVAERLAIKRDFPKAINLSGPKAQAARKRWKAAEIIAWADRQRG